jgi:GT2 family glycosyltransferase
MEMRDIGAVTLHHPHRTMPVLSIVLVNWNTRDLLLAVLGRLFEAPLLSCEVIVVDNDSSDDSVAAARAAFPQAIVLPQPKNGGFAYGVNRGLERAQGKWILLFNTDAEATWTDLANFVAAAERCPDAAVFGPKIVDEHGRVQSSTWQKHLPRHALLEALFLDRLRSHVQPTVATDVDCVSGCVFLIRASALAMTGGFDERFFMYYEEADFCERVLHAGHRVRWLPDAAFVHVGGLSAGQAAKRTFLAFRESRLLYHAAWHGRLATEWVRLCLLLGLLLRLVPWCALAVLGRRNRAALYAAAVAMLLRPGYVGELCRRPREVPKLGVASVT